MTTNKDLSTFMSTVRTRDLARSNHFRLDIDIPWGIYNDTDFISQNFDPIETTKTISLFCYFAQFPPANIQVSEMQTYGTPFWQPTIKLVDRMYIGVYLDRDFVIKRFFDAWINSIFDKDTSHLKFRDEYATTVSLYQLNKKFLPVYGVKLYDLFPTYIEPVSVHYSDKNKVSTLTSQLTYRKWEPIKLEILQEEAADNGLLGDIAGSLGTIYDAYQLYNHFKKAF